MQSLIEFQKEIFGELPERDRAPLFVFRTENGGLARVDQCDFSGHYFVWFRLDWEHQSAFFPGHETRAEANEEAKAMARMFLGYDGKGKGAIAPVIALATTPFAKQGNPRLAIGG